MQQRHDQGRDTRIGETASIAGPHGRRADGFDARSSLPPRSGPGGNRLRGQVRRRAARPRAATG
jgi:hypothetical protein